MKKLIIILALIVIVTGCGTVKRHNTDSSKGTITTIVCSDVDSILEEGGYLVDVREKDEYDEYHLDNSINVPLGDIANITNYIIGIDKDTKIIVYCKSGKRSTEAANKLVNLGYKTIYKE